MSRTAAKVFVRATDGLRSTRAFANTRLAREYVDDSGCNAAKVGRRRENVESNGLGNRGRYDCRRVVVGPEMKRPDDWGRRKVSCITIGSTAYHSPRAETEALTIEGLVDLLFLHLDGFSCLHK